MPVSSWSSGWLRPEIFNVLPENQQAVPDLQVPQPALLDKFRDSLLGDLPHPGGIRL
jgi:hypothetical protein